MNDGLTAKQAQFVVVYLQTGNASEAYRQAYDCAGMKDATINREAKVLMDNHKIATRLDELQQRAATTAVLTRAWVLERLMRNVDAGFKLDDLTASNKALELLGKTDELAMFTDRSDVNNTTTLKASGLPALAAFIHAASGAGEEASPPPALPN